VSAALLDVNVLVALFDPDHVHHEVAHDWFADNGSEGWATCPLTENGFVRVLSNPAYGAVVSRASELVDRLRRFCKGSRYQFWADDISLRDETLFDPSFLMGRQLTDIYLLGLARKHRGRLATFDRSIPLKAVVGARRELIEVVAPTNP
jgi:toxin-antitoxin system PIN domain toxin